MQEGNDDINRVVYIPFTTMSDLKDTHYLDSIWFNYQTPEYERIEPAVRAIMATQHKFNQADREAVRVFNLMTAASSVRNHYARVEDPDGFHRHAHARHWRCWADEYHAGLGYAADP